MRATSALRLFVPESVRRCSSQDVLPLEGRCLTAENVHLLRVMHEHPEPAPQTPVCHVGDAAGVNVLEGQGLDSVEDGDLPRERLRVVHEVDLVDSRDELPRALHPLTEACPVSGGHAEVSGGLVDIKDTVRPFAGEPKQLFPRRLCRGMWPQAPFSW